MRWKPVPTSVAALAVILFAFAAVAQQQKPNILVIMADDIGYSNISAYNRGQMGYRTPNIDRIANEGAILTDYYGQAILHRRPGRVYHRPEPDAHRTPQSRAAGGQGGVVG
jgi:hypothetical protein